MTSGDEGADELALFLFRPRRLDAFYREELPALPCGQGYLFGRPAPLRREL